MLYETRRGFRHFRRYCWFVLASALCLVLIPRMSGAQRPSLAVEGSLTGGDGNGGEYRVRTQSGARVGASVRGGGIAALRAYAEVTAEVLVRERITTLVCIIPRPGAGCLADFPAFTGGALTFGAIATPASRLEVRAGAGGGVYSSDGSKAGAFVSQLDIAAFVTHHIGVVAGTRALVFPSFRHDRLSSVLWSIGVRIRESCCV